MKGSTLKKLELKAEKIRIRMGSSSPETITKLWQHIDMSSIYHDWALEGQVLSHSELSGIYDEAPVLIGEAALPLNNMLKKHIKALDLAREIASSKELVFSTGMINEFHKLFSEEDENDNLKKIPYRREIPLHRTYFHEIAPPGKIDNGMRNLIKWLNDPEDALSMHPIMWIARFHLRFMRIFPFTLTSGKIGRTISNMILIRLGYLPAIIHATERQRYYETIKNQPGDLVNLLVESIDASFNAAKKFLPGSAIAS